MKFEKPKQWEREIEEDIGYTWIDYPYVTTPSHMKEERIPYHVYVKSPMSTRFSKATKEGFVNVEKALLEILDMEKNERAMIGTRYQIRKGRRIVRSLIKATEGTE